ncbi:TonB-dependent receptor [Tunturiibacter empetritectus]|uniref:Outer membrane receptor protein involved in Fe transport n=1 Tax=Tunturiibacter lichenicola TaxID=2051959 RepID=A0A852VE86_9BACT|nr:TonB-dependent receptor [Edaphobacter lichenicola]NYF89239.1 outer membrane receptor protein involved in Fe transport [Edaphobacter lichenicola]
MRKKRFSAAPSLVAAILFFFLCSHLQAQYENGSLVGTIHDSSGATVSGVSVTITNDATGIVAKATSSASGDYEVPSLRVGVYTISANSPGFSDAVAKNITISVGVRERIDLSLQVGSTQTTVEVSDVALQIETETSQRGQTITQYQSAAFPLVSRNYSDLLGLVTGSRQAPTAATTSSISSLVRAGAYNINGQRSMFNNFLLDGMDNNAYGESNQGFDNQIIAIPPDSVAQFQIVTNNESAEYGRSSGATINVASASGTNRFHATIYEFIRNTDLNAAGYFKPTLTGSSGNVVPFQKPTFNRNQFGVNFGGPILKDKLFYFVDYEGFRQVLKPLSVNTVPTTNELNGKLVVAVQNPLTGQVYPAGTAIPASAINPVSQQIINYFKQIPTQGTGLASTGLAQDNFARLVPFTDNSDKGDLRLDYQQNSNSSWFLRVSDRKETGVNSPVFPLPLDGQTNGTIRVLDQQVALGYTHLLGANKVIDARLGLSRTKAGKYSLSIGDNAISIPGLPSDPTVAGGLPSTSINGGFTSFGRQSTNPQWQNPALIDPKVNFTWIKGHHSLKFGYEYEHIWMAVNDNNPLYGSFSYSGGYSLCPSTTVAGVKVPTNPNGQSCPDIKGAVADNYWADFLFGTTNNYSLANLFVAHLRQTLHSVYAQDDWKVDPKLTLNLGLRWEYGSPYSEQHNYISNFDPITQTVLTISPGAVAGNGITPVSPGGVYGSTLVNPDLNDFAPRLGFAYAATPRTSIRGGYGTSYVHYTRAGSGDILAINAPQAQFVSVTQKTPSTTNHCPVGGASASCYVTADQGFPNGIATTFNKATDNITWVPKNTRDSYVQSYFLSVQQELAKNTLLDIAYVGNHGSKLQGFLNGNQLNPAVRTPTGAFTRPFANWPSDITTALNEFYSHYDALQVRYEQRFVSGLTLLNSFTWSHSLDNASASLEGNSPSPQDANNINADYGQSDYNLPISNVTSLVYDLPVGRGRHFLNTANAVTDTLLGGWQISAINTMQAGTVFNVGYSPNSANAVSPQIPATYRGANEYRPNIVAGQKAIKKTKLSSGYLQYINLAAFTLPETKDGSGNLVSPFGNASRNPGRSPAFYQTDVALNKTFSTPLESLRVQFRAESYNLFNHTNFYIPGSGLTGTLSTAATSTAPASLNNPTGGGQITSTFEPRIFQFGLKILY